MASKLRAPRPGDPMKAGWARSLVDEVRANTTHFLWPLVATRSPAGISVRLAGRYAASGATPLPQPWDVSFEDDVATFKQCVYVRGPVTRTVADITYQVTGADGDVYLAVQLDTDTGALTIIEGNSIAAVTESVYPEGSTLIKRLLYKAVKTTTGEGETAKVTVVPSADYRNIPVQVLHV